MVRKVALSLLFVFVVFSTVNSLWLIYRFVIAGARFTLEDGQALCARVVRLEAFHEGPPGNCDFGGKK